MKRALFLLSLLLLATLLLWAAVEGPNSPTVQGADAWATSSNMEVQNDTYGTTSTNNATVEQITFGFTAVSGTVNGVTVEWDAHCSTSNCCLVTNLLNVGTCTSKTSTALATSDTDTYTAQGSGSDTWSCTALTPANVTSASFGVSLTSSKCGGGAGGQWRVDHVRVTVDYTAAAGGRRRVVVIGG